VIRGPLAAACALLVLAAPVRARAAPPVKFNGYLQESFSLGTNEGDVLFHRQTFNGKLEAEITKWLLMRVEGDLWYDSPDFIKNNARSRLREGYFRIRLPKADLRLGRVEIAWGEADGVIISDLVSPFDIENFITPGFDEIRKGVDGAFLDYYLPKDVSLQLLWISHFEPPDFPNPESPWYPIDLDLLENPVFNVDLQPFTRPPNTFRNQEYGLRLTGHPTVADWAIGYLHSWDPRPTLRIRPSAQPGTFTATPTHDQYELFTANVAVPTHLVLVRADVAYEHGRFLQLAPGDNPDPTDPQIIDALQHEFVADHDVVRGLLGLDFKPNIRWWSQADASFQYVHEEVIDPAPLLFVADSTDLLSVLLRAAYRNETIKPLIFAIVNTRGADTWLQAKVDFEEWDNWRFSLEYDWFDGHAFDGDNGGIYGMFDDNDMVKATVRFSF